MLLVALAVGVGGPAVAGASVGARQCRGAVATVQGTPGDDWLVGTSGADVIWAGPGDDLISGLEGDDLICAGQGDDVVLPGAGADKIFGAQGADTLHGGDGDDLIVGHGGDDLITGGGGSDRMIGGAGADSISGGAGADTGFGNAGADILTGGLGIDFVDGGRAVDECLAETEQNCEARPSTGVPVAGFVFNVPITGPLAIFTNTSSGEVTSFAWDFGDGNTSSLENPVHSYARGGTYSVTLTVAGPLGTDRVVDVVSVGDQPPPDLTGPLRLLGPVVVNVTSSTSTTLTFASTRCATARFVASNDDVAQAQNAPMFSTATTVVWEAPGYPDAADRCWSAHHADLGVWTEPLTACAAYRVEIELIDINTNRHVEEARFVTSCS